VCGGGDRKGLGKNMPVWARKTQKRNELVTLFSGGNTTTRKDPSMNQQQLTPQLKASHWCGQVGETTKINKVGKLSSRWFGLRMPASQRWRASKLRSRLGVHKQTAEPKGKKIHQNPGRINKAGGGDIAKRWGKQKAFANENHAWRS